MSTIDTTPTVSAASTATSTSQEIEPVTQTPPGQQLVKSADQQALDASARLGTWLAAAESGDNSPQAKSMAAALRIEYARLLGLPPHAAAEVYVIKGNLSLSSKLCRALAHERGIKVERVKETDVSCTARIVSLRDGEVLGETTYTLAMAERAGLTKPSASGKPSQWQIRPDRMLWARASKQALDDHAPWVTLGVMSSEEIDDLEATPFDSDELLTGEVV